MTLSKKLLIMILGLIITSGTIHAQIKIIKNDDNKLFGFIMEENDTLIKFINLKHENINILKNEIKKSEKIEITVVQTNKLKFSGNIIQRTDSSFTLISSDSIKFNIYYGNIDYIYSDEPLVKSYLQNLINSKKTAPVRRIDGNKLRYKKIGLSIGSPGGLNVNFGLNNGRTAFNLSAGFSGGEIGLGLNLASTQQIELNFLLTLNFLNIPLSQSYGYGNQNELSLYVGPILDFNVFGFNLQLGYALGFADNAKNVGLIQIGYNYRYSY